MTLESFTSSFAAFSAITPLEIFAFLIPFVIAVWVDLRQHGKGQDITMKDAASWSIVWVLCSMAFAGFVYYSRGLESASLYVTGYALEKALAIDNLFAFFLIFKSFGLVTEKNQHFQHKILYWGILCAILGRVVFLGAGAFVVNFSSMVLVLFAAIVLWTVYKMWTSDDEDEEVDYTQHWSVNLVKKFVSVNPSIESGKFFNIGATPLFLCLVCVESIVTQDLVTCIK